MSRLLETIRIGWARFLRGIKTVHVQFVERDGKKYVIRRRPMHSTILIAAGNIYLRLIRTNVRLLQTPAWKDWESECHRMVNGIIVTAEPPNRLVIPFIEGQELREILLQSDDTIAQAAFGCAVRALKEAHSKPVRWPDGKTRLFSHADATCGNVICASSASAYWIDFETVHSSTLELADLRHADDLLALLCSSIEAALQARWPNDPVKTLCRIVMLEYPKPEVMANLIDVLHRRPNSYELARGVSSASLRLQMGQELSSCLAEFSGHSAESAGAS